MGRGVGIGDTPTAPPVAVVNQTFAKKFFGDSNPIGRRIGSGDPGEFEIVGAVEDTVYTDVKWTDHLMVFVPTMQRPSNYGPIENDMNLCAGAIVLQTNHGCRCRQKVIPTSPDKIMKEPFHREQIWATP